jgi:hypothetical protein
MGCHEPGEKPALAVADDEHKTKRGIGACGAGDYRRLGVAALRPESAFTFFTRFGRFVSSA